VTFDSIIRAGALTARIDGQAVEAERAGLLRSLRRGGLLSRFGRSVAVAAYAAEIAHDHAKAMTSRRAMRDAARLEYIRAAVHGAVEESEFERHTGYRLDRNHVALIASSPTSEPKKLISAALGALRAVGSTATVHALLAPNLLWAWGTLGTSVKNVSNPPPGCSGCTVVFGMPGAGIAGFRASYREAETVQSLVSLVEWRNLGKGLAYGDIGMIAEMAARPEHLYRFIRGQLGPLAAGSTYEADLRATVLAYLDANRSTTEAAARLHVAKNTVTYRMKRAEEILGRDLSRNQTELQNALRTVQILGGLPQA
jgi:hypothetical protein